VELLVVARIDERQRQHTLLLEVGLVDAREAPNDDRGTAEIARRHRRVLAAAAFAVILVSDDDPLHAGRLELARDLGERLPAGAGERIHALARLPGERVGGAEEHVVADLVEMPPEPEPRPRP